MKRAGTPRKQPAVALPDALQPLWDIAHNLWWTWNPQVASLFAELDRKKWDSLNHNPVAMLLKLSAAAKGRLADDVTFTRRVDQAHGAFREYMQAKTWYAAKHGTPSQMFAYFSMEYGLHESLPIYAGGLGVLAGDHFKSASDLGLPLVGVGVFWRQGYNRQLIDESGRQLDGLERVSAEALPLTEVQTPDNRPLRLRLKMAGDIVVVRAWRLQVGRVQILLLDTNLPENAARHRKLTERLYSGDRDTRIRQEILLGIGGWRVLKALKLPVAVCHLNEGHAAFCSLDRVAEVMREEGCAFKPAAKQVAASTVFTTHTPIPEGNEVFDVSLFEKYFGKIHRELEISHNELLGLARVHPQDESEQFGMTPLALRLSDRRNGVSRLHGEVSRKMWQELWPGKPVEKVPIGSITNGIHLRTWLHPRMAELYDRYLAKDWDARQDSAAVFRKALAIPDDVLWRVHLDLKRELIEYLRECLQQQLKRYGASAKKIDAAGASLDPEALTVGFARRFAIYKRAGLIFTDRARLARLINQTGRPVQFVFAGKAHPADEAGKRLVAFVAKQARSSRFKGRIVFLENYSFDVARHMVAGVDVWLNNPQRPREASGTSGMKPTLHGGLNASILDGWWPEGAKHGVNGWNIGEPVDHDGSRKQDKLDAEALYEVFENEITPKYHKRNAAGLPSEWTAMMKQSIATVPAAFNSHRMVKEYLTKYYLPALRE